MKYRVKKGLETPLLIKGMLHRLFYIWFSTSLILVVLAAGMLNALVKGGINPIVFVAVLLISFLVFIGMKILFVNMSKRSKMRRFSNTKKFTITHIDILKVLK